MLTELSRIDLIEIDLNNGEAMRRKMFIQDHEGDKALTTEDACHFLSISRQTLYKLVKTRRIPGRKVGENYRFLKSDLIHYFKGE